MEAPSKVRVVVTGPTSLDKSAVLTRLCQYIQRVEPESKAAWYAAERTLGMDAFLDAGGILVRHVILLYTKKSAWRDVSAA
jgi:hypothetical protein